MCAAAGTPIATPRGEQPIEHLAVGAFVYSVDDGAVVAVPVVRVSRTRVPSGHEMVRVLLTGGRALEMSPGHPTADGRSFADLVARAMLDGVEVLAVTRVDYDGEYTYDLLPASSTGAYYAAGVLVGSTLAREVGSTSMETDTAVNLVGPGAKPGPQIISY